MTLLTAIARILDLPITLVVLPYEDVWQGRSMAKSLR